MKTICVIQYDMHEIGNQWSYIVLEVVKNSVIPYSYT